MILIPIPIRDLIEILKRLTRDKLKKEVHPCSKDELSTRAETIHETGVQLRNRIEEITTEK